ncbi:MAG: maleylpyruvate isomerase family mycothiol-dependent enzyme [Nocardiopsaceae bacterium]|nr:maleylpyruvate isomerase family mycothiol-dependent enzyme [Nocardiopsaceae bacterium]
MEIAEHIDAIRDAGGRLSAGAAKAGPDAAVPSCPEWVVRDLVRHQGGVHRWAAGIVTTPRTEHWNVELDEVVGTWPDDADLVAWFDAGADALANVLTQADPALTCWAFLPAPSPLAFWARRQAHETSVHGVDAELAAGGPVAPFSPGFAADGIGELLVGFAQRRGRLRSENTRTLRVRCADVAADWLVSIGPDRVQTTPGDGRQVGAAEPADCEVAGTADDLYLALWNRRRPDCLDVAGDRAVLDLFLDRLNIRWS